MKKTLQRLTIHWLEQELILVIAIATILGGLIGYSLAAAIKLDTQITLPSKAALVSGDELE